VVKKHFGVAKINRLCGKKTEPIDPASPGSIFSILCNSKCWNLISNKSKNRMTIYIQYMVSFRCKLLVKAELDKLGLLYTSVELGEVQLREGLSADQHARLSTALLKSGLELMSSKKTILIEKIKHIVIEMVHHQGDAPVLNASAFISSKLDYDFNYLSKLFSEVKGTTIEHCIIAHKIERVKELLLYDELNLTEISYQLNYSSVAHLSSQFKKITGLTPTHFKKMKAYKKRIAHENV